MVLAGLGLAFLSALTSMVGFLMRHRGAVAAAEVDIRRPLRSAIELSKQKWWTIGYALAFVAYVFHVGALSLTSLSLVQVVLAGGLVLLGVIAERYFGHKLGRRQWIGMTLAAIGLAFLAVTGEAKSGQETANYSVAAMIAFEAALVGIGVALVLSCRMDRARNQLGVMLGAAAGLLFTVTHVAVKAMSGKVDTTFAEIVLNPFLAIALAGAVVAFFASARSLQIGPAVPVIAVTAIAGNASSIPAGIIVFGDPLGGDAVTVALRSLAFVLVIVAAAVMPAPTRAAGVEEDQAEPDEPDERAAGRGEPAGAPA